MYYFSGDAGLDTSLPLAFRTLPVSPRVAFQRNVGAHWYFKRATFSAISEWVLLLSVERMIRAVGTFAKDDRARAAFDETS